MSDDIRDIFNSTADTSEDRQAYYFGIPAAQPPPPAVPQTVLPSLSTPVPGTAASGTTSESGPGFWSSLWSGVKTVAPEVGKAVVQDALARSAARQAPNAPVAAPAPARPPTWLWWALAGIGGAILAVLLLRD